MTGSGPYTQGLQFIRSWLSVWTSGKGLPRNNFGCAARPEQFPTRFRGTAGCIAAEARRALSTHIEESYLQAERGELVDGAQARRDIQEMKQNWHHDRLSKRRFIWCRRLDWDSSGADMRQPTEKPRQESTPAVRWPLTP
jgi:hypothetical protein